jgi:hypothetical protein
MKNKKFIGLFIFVALIAFIAIKPGKANAYGLNYSKFYVAVNGGLGSTSLGSGYSTKSRGTYNISLGDNYHLNKIVVGGGVSLGYADDGSFDNNYYGNAYSISVDSVYYAAFVKGGYDYHNITPFVKLGYIDYAYTTSYSYAEPQYNYSGVSGVSSEGGILYGVGVKYAFTPNWGVTAQYMGASLSSSITVNNYLIGVDYSF